MTPKLGAYAPAAALGVTQIVGYGTLMYAYAILLPRMAETLDLSLSTVFGILSLGLFFGGCLSPVAGMLVDRFGGRWVMTLGALVAAGALLGMSQVDGPRGLFALILVAEAAGMFVLYNVAFASVARLDSPIRPARAISIITLFGGVASTIFWPMTLALETRLGWETTWVILGLMMLVIAAPLNNLALRGPERLPEAAGADAQPDWPQLTGSARRRGMLWMVISFVFSGYLMGAVMTLWVTNVEDLGHSAAMAALAGAIIGPFKTVGRALEMIVSRNMYPLMTYAMALGLTLLGFAVILTVGFTVVGIVVAAALYGMGDGIKTIARGTLPLALFGQKGYGARLGWINSASMAVNASGPFVFATITQAYGGWASFAGMTSVLCLAIATFVLIPDPRRSSLAPSHPGNPSR